MVILIYFYLTLLVSESLSIFNQFTLKNLQNFNLVIIFISLTYLFSKRDYQYKLINLKPLVDYWPYVTVIGTFSTVAIISGAGIAPNNWDSMTYHFTRYLHWFSNKNLDHFFTSNNRENTYPVLPDLLFAQIFSTTSNDKFLFLVTWICLFLSSFYIFKITLILSESLKASFLASCVALILPSHVAFMSSTQTDPISTFLVVILFYFTILLRKNYSNRIFLLTIMMIPLFLTSKTTGLILSLPLYIYNIFIHKEFLFKNTLKNITLSILILLPAIPYIYRLSKAERSILTENVFVSDPAIMGTLINAIRIFLSQIQTPVPLINNFIQDTYYNAAKFLNFTANPDSYSRYGDFSLSSSLHGDFTGNPMHLVLLVASVFGLRRIKKYKILTGLLTTQWVLMASFIGWQPWINRFTSTILTLGAILIGVWLSKISKKNLNIILTTLVIYSSFWMFFNPSRSLVNPKSLVYLAEVIGIPEKSLGKVRHDFVLDKSQQYFSARPELETSYIESLIKVTKLNDPRLKTIYINITGNDYQYPIFTLTNFRYGIHHFDAADIAEIKKGEAVLFCTLECAGYGLKNLYRDDFVTVWR